MAMAQIETYPIYAKRYGFEDITRGDFAENVQVLMTFVNTQLGPDSLVGIENVTDIPAVLKDHMAIHMPGVKKLISAAWMVEGFDDLDFMFEKYSRNHEGLVDDIWRVSTPEWDLVCCTNEFTRRGYDWEQRTYRRPAVSLKYDWADKPGPYMPIKYNHLTDFKLFGDRDAFDRDLILMKLNM